MDGNDLRYGLTIVVCVKGENYRHEKFKDKSNHSIALGSIGWDWFFLYGVDLPKTTWDGRQ